MPFARAREFAQQLIDFPIVKQVSVQAWLKQFCRRSPGVANAVVFVATNQPTLATLARWPADGSNDVALLVAAKVAMKTGEPVSHVPPRMGADPKAVRGRVIALPLQSGGRVAAAVAISINSDDPAVADQTRRNLRRAVEFFGQSNEQGDAPARTLDANSSMRVLAALLRHQKFRDAAAGAATELASLLGVDRVSVGWIDDRDAEVVAVSHGADVDSKRQAFRAIAAAMDEGIAQREIISHPPQPDDSPRITLAHAALVQAQGGAVCSVPLASGTKIVGALLLERGGSIVLDKSMRAFCEHIGSLLGLVLELKHRADAPWHARLRQARRGAVTRLMQRGHLGSKLAAGALAALLAAVLLVPVTHRVGAPAHLEGATQRALVAPNDGFLQQAHVRPGDAVHARQVLVELADEELKLERRKWAAELAQHENGYGAALAQADRAQMVIFQAKVAEAQAQLELAEQWLARSRVVAPFDGVVIRGDLNQALGSPVKRGDLLLTIAPRDDFRIIVRVDERDIADLREGLAGHLALAALPEQNFAIRVERITPVARAENGRNFFEVEAKLTQAATAALRPGLEGIAKIEAGEASLAWIWGRRLINGLRLTLWSWGL